MKVMVTTSRAVLLSALLGAALAGCGREAPEQTGAAGTSGTPPSASSTAGGTGTTGTAPDTSGSTAGMTGGTGTGTTGAAGGADSSTAGASSGTAGTAGTAGTPSSGSSDTSSSSGASGTGAASSAGAVIDDSIISTKIKTALLADADIKGSDIVVETKKGEVQLSGFVRDKTQIDKAVKVASAVEGVKKVDNKMTVKQ